MDPFLTNEKAQRDYQLVLAARDRGDQRAYADLMRYYREPIYLMLLRMTHSPVDADDLTIEAFGKAFRQLSSYTPQNTFATWLFSIASNHGIDFIRRQHMRLVPLNSMSVTDEDDAYEYPFPSDDPTPEEELITRQRDKIVRDLVDRLAPRYRRIVNMRYFDELSYEEIAKQLNIPLGTVKIQLRRARLLLAEIIKSQKHSL
ncbi:MAG: sigma-70 family RNA polymerase sigma factor [Bacteroidales bacterium]|jgi:RNA polymerase sigma-70 factor (ECF subfamily)|nr:sigma-70 family RNA polymerase sigma factor [Bacteroidales bacterium]